MHSGLLLVGCAAIAAAVPNPPLGYERRLLREAWDKRGYNDSSSTTCPRDAAPSTTAPLPNFYQQISAKDNAAVWGFLHDPATGLNLTHPDEATLTDNYVFFIDTVPVNKSDVLAYKEGGPLPPKFARVILFEGGKEEPDSQEYMVGPLPMSAESGIKPLDWIYNGGMGGKVPFNARYFDGPRSAATEPLIARTMSSIADITSSMFQGGVYYGSDNERTNLTFTEGTPISWDGMQAFRNIMFRYPGPATYLTPIDFYLLIDCTGTDASHYFVKGFVTNTRFFETEADLRAAFEAGEVAQKYDQSLDASWAMLDYKPELGVRDLEERLAPSSLELDGKRYRVDPEAQYVEYMGWSFFISFSRTVGISLHDIRFKGESVIYELSLQEALAQYAGNQPKAANTVYQDTYYGIGTYMASLIEGFDCPFGSTMWNVSWHEADETVVARNAICIFEHDLGFPVSRHRTGGGPSEYGFANFGAVKGAQLTVRTIATIGNYDYMFDFSFNLDAVVEVAARASGYLQSSFYYPDQKSFGPRIQEGTMGSLHDHVLTFKADFDVITPGSNSLQVSELETINVTQPWFPELGEFEMFDLNISYMQEEQQFNWGDNNQKMFVILNKNETNQWGEPRGYRIVPGLSDIHLSTMNSPFSLKNSEYAKSHLALTRQHDNEPFANSIQNVNLPWAPQQDFAKFFDNENVDGEDVVLWFNLGMHHYTRAEDVPVTLFTEAYSSIKFSPQNFFARAQDGDLRNRIWAVPTETEDGSGEYYLDSELLAAPLPTCSLRLNDPVDGIETLVADYKVTAPKADSILNYHVAADNMDPSSSHSARTRPIVASRLPASLRFVLVYILALSLRTGLYTLLGDYVGTEMAAISRDLEDKPYQVGVLFAWKLTELGSTWLAGYDYADVGSLAILAHLPYYFLITSFYTISLQDAAIAFAIEVFSVTLPFRLLRGVNQSHDPAYPDDTSAPNRALASDKSIVALVTILGASIQSIVIYSSFYTWLPTHLILHFDGLRSLARAHEDSLILLVRSFLPTGLAAMAFLFAPTIGAPQNPGRTKPKDMRFNPETATFMETLVYNLGLGEHGLTHRAEILTKRTAVLAFSVFANTVVRTYSTIEGTDLVGSLGYASVWSVTSLLMGVAYAWVSDE
ncbi:hypothetical protein MBLNU230_g0388t1 [Neophaeotheca triangularis]